jgi:hypothetical protein
MQAPDIGHWYPRWEFRASQTYCTRPPDRFWPGPITRLGLWYPQHLAGATAVKQAYAVSGQLRCPGTIRKIPEPPTSGKLFTGSGRNLEPHAKGPPSRLQWVSNSGILILGRWYPRILVIHRTWVPPTSIRPRPQLLSHPTVSQANFAAPALSDESQNHPRQESYPQEAFGLWNPTPNYRRVAHNRFRTLEPRVSDVGTPEYCLSTGPGYPLLIIESIILLIAGGSKVRTCFSSV